MAFGLRGKLAGEVVVAILAVAVGLLAASAHSVRLDCLEISRFPGIYGAVASGPRAEMLHDHQRDYGLAALKVVCSHQLNLLALT
jgi:hypothetical protein